MKISRHLAFSLALLTLMASAGLLAFQRDRASGGEVVALAPDSVSPAGAAAPASSVESTAASRPEGTSSRVKGGRTLKPRLPAKEGGVERSAPASVERGEGREPTPERRAPDSAAPAAVPPAAPPAVASGTPEQPAAPKGTTFAFGAGAERLPRWLGATGSKTFAVPYVNINWQDRVEFSTVDGLVVDFLHGEQWHGGLVGTMMWGRSRHDLGRLADSVPTRGNTLQAGAYLEYAITKELSVGVRLRHDIQATGAAYGDIYVDLDLPTIGFVEHSLKLAGEAMNRSAMRRYFGLSPEEANRLGTAAYQPNGGRSQASVTYDIFVPTSKSTGVAMAASYGRLSGAAADSPLVRNFGSPHQRNLMGAFIYHF